MTIADKIFNLPIPILNNWGYWAILAVSLLEATPLFGFLAPGMLVVIIGGVLAKQGILNIWHVMIFASIGAILGDLTGYYIGKKFGYPFLTRFGKYFFFKKEKYDNTKKLMNQHTGKTLIVGRFNSLTRSLAPFIAGSTHVPFTRFMGFNIIGGISWSVTFVLVGFIFGKSYEIASKYLGRFIFIALVLSIGLVYLYRFIDKRKHIFSKYHLYALTLNIISLYLFSKMVEDIIDNEFVTKIDLWLNLNIINIWSPIFTKIMIFITNIGSQKIMIILFLLTFGILIYRKKWYYSLLLTFSMLGGLILEILFKNIMMRARPTNSLIEVTGYSFPSGHSAMAIIYFSVIIYSFKEEIKNKNIRYLFIVANVSLFLLVGFSRLYLNVHWFSDIVGGFTIGLFWMTFLVLLFKTVDGIYQNKLNQIKKKLDSKTIKI